MGQPGCRIRPVASAQALAQACRGTSSPAVGTCWLNLGDFCSAPRGQRPSTATEPVGHLATSAGRPWPGSTPHATPDAHLSRQPPNSLKISSPIRFLPDDCHNLLKRIIRVPQPLVSGGRKRSTGGPSGARVRPVTPAGVPGRGMAPRTAPASANHPPSTPAAAPTARHHGRRRADMSTKAGGEAIRDW